MRGLRRARWLWAAGLLLALAACGFAALHSRQGRPHDSGMVDLERASWRTFGGAWTFNGSHVENASEERGLKAVLRSEQRGDVAIDADMRISAVDGEAGLLLRSGGEEPGVDSYHGYFVGVRVAEKMLELGRADFGWHSLARVTLPETVDLQEGFHLRAVAVGCSFAVELRAKSGLRQVLGADDPGCIRSGHPGVRSTLTSAVWDHLSIGPAAQSELARVTQDPSANRPLLKPEEPFDTARSAAYEASLREEAQRRALQAGVQPISRFLMLPGRHPNVTLQGAVISLPPLVAIQDDTNALIIPTFHSNAPLKLGDIVLANGTLVSERFRSSLEDANIRVLWSELPSPPFAVTAAQLTGGTWRGRKISLDGTLISASSSQGNQELILRDGDLVFRGVGTPGYHIDLRHLENGSRLRLHGFASSMSQLTYGTYPFAILIEQVDVISSPPWWSPRHIALLALGCVFLLLVAQFSYHRAQQWRIESVMKEREELAFEMHDTLAQSFTGIAFQLRAADLERRGEERLRVHIRHALEMVDQSHKEASRTIAALRPQLRDSSEILEALRQAALRLADGGSLRVTTLLSGRQTRLPVQVIDVLFRVAQEAISNAVQHSGCTELRLELTSQRGETRLSVHDNGRGFEAAAPHAGLGIAGMRARAGKVRGRLEIVSSTEDVNSGTTVALVVPLPRTARLLRPISSWISAGLPLSELLFSGKERRHGHELRS